jgi:hypothetical protein
VAEGEVLRNAIRIGRIDLFDGPEGTAAFGVFGGHQMAFASAEAHRFAGATDLKPLGNGFACLNSLGASHIKLLSQKRAGNIGNECPVIKWYFWEFLDRDCGGPPGTLHFPGEKRIRAADAKEVGVGNPAEETYRYPNQSFLSLTLSIGPQMSMHKGPNALFSISPNRLVRRHERVISVFTLGCLANR